MLFCVHTILAQVRTILYCFVFCIFIKLGEIHISQKKSHNVYCIQSENYLSWRYHFEGHFALYEEVTVLKFNFFLIVIPMIRWIIIRKKFMFTLK